MTITTETTARPTGIPVRRPKQDVADSQLDRWIVPADPFFSHFLAALSAVFPNGEDFFVASVRNFRSVVDDDADLKERVRGFIGQEATHGREHRRVNLRLDELGYPAARLDRALGRSARRLSKLPARVQLAVTAASEHFTTVMAEAVLGDEETRRTLFPQEGMQLLITWHALEELEHKDVAFDVLERVGGGYLLRQLGMLLAAVEFGTVVLRGYAYGLVVDRRHLTPAARRRHARNLRHQKMVGPDMVRGLSRYLSPGFHPRRTDTDDLVNRWRQELEPQLTTARARAS